jgi:NADH-quinone oxidoreductase subunit F
LIEVPMGITIREIVENIGGGVADGRKFKAVQIGGPSGGCVPSWLADTPIDYESLNEVGAMMGSGGLVVLDDTDCMVDISRYFLAFTQSESCGKCTFCRVGTRRMLDILNKICSGKGTPRDLEELENLAGWTKKGSLCGLGKTAPNPVLSTLHYFREEYEAHIHGKCPTGKCRDLIHYHIEENCIGCTKCAQNCPVNAIAFTPYEVHQIDQAKCIKCDGCRQVCPEDAVTVN